MEKEQKEVLLIPKEVCKYFRIKKQTLYNWTHKKLIPYVKLPGGKNSGIRFEQKEIDGLLREGKVEQFKAKSRPIFGELRCGFYAPSKELTYN